MGFHQGLNNILIVLPLSFEIIGVGRHIHCMCFSKNKPSLGQTIHCNMFDSKISFEPIIVDWILARWVTHLPTRG